MLRNRGRDDRDDTSNTITLQDAVSTVIDESQLERNAYHPIVTTPYRKINFSNVNWYVHVYLRQCKLELSCYENNLDVVEFKALANVKTPTMMSPTNHVYLSFEHYPKDYKLNVQNEPIQVHRHFLALLSPVFHAMFTHDTVESRTGKSEIQGIDYKSVVSAIDFCYGRKLDLSDTNNVIGILRFGDRYDIKSITATLQYVPFTDKINERTFCNVLSYAYDMSLGALTFSCAEYFRQNTHRALNSTKFGSLPIPVVLNFLSAAYGTDDNFEIFHLACKDNMKFITDYLEPSIISGLNADTFCSTMSFSFKYQREKLKPLCAAFFNQHMAEIMSMPEFVNLESEVIKQILKAALDLKNTESGRSS
uniref:BTB domain-containing protein n=1 Tax=Panagrellus redivivus TaxID=6233 RepID=A0A7E4UUG0_PANRE